MNASILAPKLPGGGSGVSGSGFSLGGGSSLKKSATATKSGNSSSSDESGEDVAPLPTPKPSWLDGTGSKTPLGSAGGGAWGSGGGGWRTGGASALGGMSPHDPVWKHEVTL